MLLYSNVYILLFAHFILVKKIPKDCQFDWGKEVDG